MALTGKAQLFLLFTFLRSPRAVQARFASGARRLGHLTIRISSTPRFTGWLSIFHSEAA